ncbi:MAG: GNAT family N-acetyltransferase [Halioglobus sp.]|nr:GNAT family N-acetyltransferase [Halioglobus sp.]
MQKQPKIRDGSASDLDTLVATLSDSFAADPVLNWVMPRPQLYPDFFRVLVRDVYLPRGIVHMEQRGRGAALWLPPGEPVAIPAQPGLIAMLGRLVLHRGPVPLWRIHRQGALFARHHPREQHFYLQFIGCRQRDQGRGIGAALLERGTRACDDQQMPAYLESSNRLNVPLYQRHGFEVIHQQRISARGPTVWFMWRDPR